ncbi:MAG: hypothetical protein WBX19_12610 [Terracidiphilus sp.]
MIEETAHAPGLRALKVDQAHLAPPVVAVGELRQKAFVAERIAFEPGNAILDRAAESKADFESVLSACCSSIEGHRELSGWIRLKIWIRLENQRNQLKVSQSWPILATSRVSRQITMSPNLCNQTVLKNDMAGE